MFNFNKKKLIIVITITFAVCGIGTALYYNTAAEHGPIYVFNPERDTKEIMDIFYKDWDWLLASRESSPAFMIKYRTHDANPAHFGSLHIRVLREDNKVAGFTSYFMESKTEGRLLFLAVNTDFRGRGYGKMLALDAIDQLFKMGADHVTLWTRVSNIPAQTLYRQLGFREMFEDNGYLFFEFRP